MVSFRRGRALSITDLTGYALYALGVCLHALRATRWIAPLILVIACKRIIRSRRSRAESADVTLARDKRHPVLYLRSFSEDESVASGSEHEKGLMLKTTEEVLALAFEPVGPLVCIGRPNEEMPELGAARLYASSGEWQPKVQELIERARLIVLHLGSTPGFWWEVEQAVTRIDRHRLLFFVPLGGGPLYEQLTTFMESRFGIELPVFPRSRELHLIGEKHPEAYFVFFDTAGRPALLPVWPGLMQPGLYSDRAVVRTLAPAFLELGLGRPLLAIHPYIKWVALFILPALFLNYFLWGGKWAMYVSSRRTVTAQHARLNVARARAEVLALHVSLLRLQKKTGYLPRADEWLDWMAAQGGMTDEVRREYKATGKLTDPWGFPYTYHYPGRKNTDSFDVYSLGADGREGGTGPDEDIWNVGPTFDAYRRSNR